MKDTRDILWAERVRLAQAGDTAVQEALVADNLDLVRSVVSRFGMRGAEWDDLFQTGCIGLVKAILRFDVSREVRFSTYAVPMIVGELKQYFRENQKIRISRSLRELAKKVRETESLLASRIGREPTVKEVADCLGVLPNRIVEAMEAMHPVRSLDEADRHSTQDKAQSLLEEIAADTVRPDDVDRLYLAERMEQLPWRERQIVRRRFWQDETQAEVAAELGISQVHVSRLEKKALLFLRQEK